MKFNTQLFCALITVSAIASGAEIPKTRSVEICLKPDTAPNPDHKTTEMIKELKNKNYQYALDYVSKGADLNACGSSTPLEIIARRGDLEGVKQLIARGARTDLVGYDGNSVIHEAVKSGNLDLVKYLLTLPKDLNLKNMDDRTPLMLAVERPSANIEIVKALVEAGASIKSTDKFQTNALFIAAHYRNYEALEYLIEKGGIHLLDLKNCEGETIAELYNEQNQPEVGRKLKELTERMRVDAYQKDIKGLNTNCLEFMDAALKKDYRTANDLITRCNNFIQAAGAAYRKSGDNDLVRYFKYIARTSKDENDPKYLEQQKYQYEVPLHELPEPEDLGEINERDENGRTQLMRAANFGSLYNASKDIMKDLLRMGAKIDMIDNEGENALFRAFKMAQPLFLRCLLKNGGRKLVEQTNFKGEVFYNWYDQNKISSNGYMLVKETFNYTLDELDHPERSWLEKAKKKADFLAMLRRYGN